ncbi:MAG: formimidoylglutamate deiminase, partial [Stackebrandtia sp.]
PHAGRIAVGADAAFVAVDTASVRLAGAEPAPAAAVVFAAAAADVTHVVRGGELIVDDRRHVRVDDVAGDLSAAVTALFA